MRMFTIAAAALALGAASPAIAGPSEPIDGARLVLVSGGCGPYFHRGPAGQCIENGYMGCPPGFHIGPYGRRCQPDRPRFMRPYPY